VGEVSNVQAGEYSHTVEIKTEKVWKGEIGKTIVIQTSKWECGYPFVRGKKYLIYVYGKAPFAVSQCSRTKPIESASEDLKELGEGKQPN